MFETIGLLATTTEKNRLAEWTFDIFKAEFKLRNQERIEKLTADMAGYQGAHHDTSIIPNPTMTPEPASAANVTPSHSPLPSSSSEHVIVEGSKMYYSWTHGLNPARKHTSHTCLHKADGHKDDAITSK